MVATLPASRVSWIHLQDPSGYLWEILPAMGEAESVREINVVVSDLAASVKFYTEALGMTVMRTESTQGATGYQRVRTTPLASRCKCAAFCSFGAWCCV